LLFPPDSFHNKSLIDDQGKISEINPNHSNIKLDPKQIRMFCLESKFANIYVDKNPLTSNEYMLKKNRKFHFVNQNGMNIKIKG